MTSRPTPRACAAALAVVLPVTGAAFAVPAAAAPTLNDTVYAVTDANTGASSIKALNLGTGRSTVLLSSATAGYGEPERSRDGRELVFTYDNSVGNSGIEVQLANGGLQILTTHAASDFTSDFGPTLSPDGATVVFTRVSFASGTQALGLYQVPVGGGTATPIPGGNNHIYAAYDPAGTTLVTADVSGAQPALQLLNPSTGAITPLGVDGAQGRFSPDGSTIVYSTQTGGLGTQTSADDVVQLATIASDGGAHHVLPGTHPTSAVTQALGASWLPDGRSLTYSLDTLNSAGDTTNTALWAIDRAGVRNDGRLLASVDEGTGQTQGPPLGSAVAGTPSTFVPVTPTRLLDTRNGTGAPQAKVGPAGIVSLQIAGRTTPEGPIPADVTAVVLNVTLADGTTATNIRVYPSGGVGIPTTSNINAEVAGQVVPDLVTTSVGPDGKVSLFNAAGTVNLLADVAGYYVPASGTTGVRYAPLEPRRILDSRTGLGTRQAVFGPREARDLKVTGSVTTTGGQTVTVPTTATAVVLNLTGTQWSTATNIRVYPTPAAGTGVPTVSNLNLSNEGNAVANLVTVSVGSAGSIRLFNAAGTVHLLADLAGYYDAAAPGVFVPVAPLRLLDTRTGTGAAPLPVTPVNRTVDIPFGGNRGVPSDALAAVLTLTGVGALTPTVVRAYPSTSSIPTVSNLNLDYPKTRANAAIVKPGTTGAIRLLNGAGTLDLLADLAGYFTNG